jgi:hypothetical protein
LNKIVPIKNANAIFLATVLVAGIIALSSPSFMTGAQAQQDYGMEREYGSHEQPEYGSYEQQTEYPSYKPDYKPEYPSDNNSYKSKKDSGDSISLNINKLKCINNNVNINGNNNGTINVGNSGKSATGPGTDEGYVGVGSVGSGNGEEGYGNNGYNKQKGEAFHV